MLWQFERNISVGLTTYLLGDLQRNLYLRIWSGLCDARPKRYVRLRKIIPNNVGCQKVNSKYVPSVALYAEQHAVLCSLCSLKGRVWSPARLPLVSGPWLRGRSTGILTLCETTRYSVSAIHVRTADQILMLYGTVCEALPVSQVMQTLTDKGSEVVRAPNCIKIIHNIAAFRTNSKKNFTHTVAFVERGAVHHHTSVTPGEVKLVHCLQSTRIGGHHWRHGYYIPRKQLLVATIQSAR